MVVEQYPNSVLPSPGDGLGEVSADQRLFARVQEMVLTSRRPLPKMAPRLESRLPSSR
jgi:hypothetical protein